MRRLLFMILWLIAETLDEAEQKEFLEEMISPHLHGMFVTPKDVDETINI